MTYTINWKNKAVKQLSKIAPAERGKIVSAVGSLRELETARNVTALTEHEHGYRLRVGRYRVLFDADRVVRVLEIQEVKKRDGNTY